MWSVKQRIHRKTRSLSSILTNEYTLDNSDGSTIPPIEGQARLWRNLMHLQLPMDGEKWNDDDQSIPLTPKPGLLNTNNLLIYQASVMKSETAVLPGKVVQSRTPGRSILKLKKTKSHQLLPTLIITDPDNIDQVFDLNPAITGVITPKASVFKFSRFKITNKLLKEHDSTWQRIRRCICCKKEVHPLELDTFEPGPRTANSMEYINRNISHLLSRRIPQGRTESRNALVKAYNRTLEAVAHIAKIKELCEKAVQTLSYNKYCQERQLTEDELKLTNKRSIIGSLMWMSTYCIQFIAGKDIKTTLKADVKLRIEDVVGSSVLLWSAMVHLIETAKCCASILEHSIVKYIFSLKAPDEERRDSESPHDEILPDKFDCLRRKRWQVKHLAEIKEAMEDIYYWKGNNKILRPQIKVFTKDVESEENWSELTDTKTYEILSVIIKTSTKLLGIIEDELIQLTNLDKAVQSIVTSLESVQKSTNFLECVLILEKILQSFHEFPYNLLKQIEIDELKEVGRIILDKIDGLMVVLEELLAIGFEAFFIVHVSYEYIRVYYKWPLAEYDHFAPDNHKKYMEIWAHNSEFQVSKPPESINEPIQFFHDSVYQHILKTIILTIADIDVCVGSIDDTVPTAAIAAKVIQTTLDKAPAIEKFI